MRENVGPVVLIEILLKIMRSLLDYDSFSLESAVSFSLL